MTVETRRSQFRQKSVSLNESRPSYMRAMFAPIRQNPPPETKEKVATLCNQAQNWTKKRLRRKKITTFEIDSFSIKFSQSQPSKLISQRSFDERPSTAKSERSAMSYRALKSSKLRAKSAMNGSEIVTLDEEIVTLVSLHGWYKNQFSFQKSICKTFF